LGVKGSGQAQNRQDMMQASIAERTENGGTFTQRVDPAVYDALINLLMSKNG